MCYFVVLAVPAALAAGVVERFREPGLDVDPADPSLFEGLPPGSAPLLVSGGGCACGWYQRPRTPTDEERERARRRYAKRGWSTARIERALAQAARGRRRGEGLHPVIVDLARRVRAEAGSCAVLVHDYRGKVDREKVSVRSRSAASGPELRERAAELGLDELLEIHG